MLIQLYAGKNVSINRVEGKEIGIMPTSADALQILPYANCSLLDVQVYINPHTLLPFRLIGMNLPANGRKVRASNATLAPIRMALCTSSLFLPKPLTYIPPLWLLLALITLHTPLKLLNPLTLNSLRVTKSFFLLSRFPNL